MQLRIRTALTSISAHGASRQTVSPRAPTRLTSPSSRQVHTQLLTSKWHELLVLTTCSYQAIHGLRPALSITSDTQSEFQQEVRRRADIGRGPARLGAERCSNRRLVESIIIRRGGRSSPRNVLRC